MEMYKRTYLKEKRKELMMTQADVARELGINRSNYAYMESGNDRYHQLSDWTIDKLSDILDISVHDICHNEALIRAIRILNGDGRYNKKKLHQKYSKL